MGDVVDGHHARSGALLVARIERVIIAVEVSLMVTNDRQNIEDVLQLARQIAARLEPMSQQAASTDALCLRLAQAHALGLVDQLCEIVGEGPSSSTTRFVNGAPRTARSLDDDQINAL